MSRLRNENRVTERGRQVKEVWERVPGLDELLALPSEELAGIMLFAIRRRFGRKIFFPGNLIHEFRETPNMPMTPDQRDDLSLAAAEALGWAEAQGLFVAANPMNPTSRQLSRRARGFETEEDFTRFAQGVTLPRSILHPAIREKAYLAFLRGDFDYAAFQAMKAVEIAVRSAGGFPDNIVGTDLMRQAFHTENGPLTDGTMNKAEAQARSSLFAGAIGSMKNPQSHREVSIDDPAEAIEIVLLANHLLKIVEERKKVVSNAAS